MAKVHDSATDLITFARGSSATYTGSDGTQQTAASDEPRIEYAADGSLKGLLIEEQRTNLLLNSDNPDTQVATLAAGSHTLSFVGGPSVTGIDDTITANAVDVFIYDTSKDSDGGAWRTGSLAQASSWYAEASSPTRDPNTRSTRAEFPAVAVIVAESNKVTIYDGDDPALPMWMVFNAGFKYTIHGSRPITSISMLNGELRVGQAGSGAGNLSEISFLADKSGMRVNSTVYYYIRSALSQRNTSVTTDGAITAGLVNRDVNDVAMTVLPDAPTDPATGLPVPTIAVATNGGVSIIKDDGTVVDITNSSSNDYSYSVSFGANNFLNLQQGGAGPGAGWLYVFDEIPAADTVITNNTKTGSTASPIAYYAKSGLGNDLYLLGDPDHGREGDYIGTDAAIVALAEDPTAPTKGMVAYTTSTYNTGWMNGDIKLAALANSATADRSVNNNPLTQNGTITAAPVETGADLVAYSGFSGSNYLEQPYNSDLDFGTGDFCVMGWVKYDGGGTQTLIGRGASKLQVFLGSSGAILGRVGGGGNTLTVSNAIPSGVWSYFAYLRSSGVTYMYVNGALVGSVANTQSASDATATTKVGTDGIFHASSTIALLRISATAPTADQIAKIYNDEKVLFQENAKATLTGSSDAVTALAHDPDTNLLHVGTSGGRSVFYGLRRVNETATAVTTAISAVDGLIVEQ